MYLTDHDMIEERYTDILKHGVCFYKKECLVMKKNKLENNDI